jgi:hypothetical protein
LDKVLETLRTLNLLHPLPSSLYINLTKKSSRILTTPELSRLRSHLRLPPSSKDKRSIENLLQKQSTFTNKSISISTFIDQITGGIVKVKGKGYIWALLRVLCIAGNPGGLREGAWFKIGLWNNNKQGSRGGGESGVEGTNDVPLMGMMEIFQKIKRREKWVTPHNDKLFFGSKMEFRKWNTLADIRWGIDTCLRNRDELALRLRIYKKSNPGSTVGSVRSGDDSVDLVKENLLPPLQPDLLTSNGRHLIVTSLLEGTPSSNIHDVLNSVECILKKYFQEGDEFKDDNERWIVVAGIVCFATRKFVRRRKEDEVKVIQIRAFDSVATASLIAYDSTTVMERRGYHDLAAYILGGIVEDGGGGMKRRTVGKVCERFLVDWKHDYNKRGKEGKERGKERGILEEGMEGQGEKEDGRKTGGKSQSDDD